MMKRGEPKCLRNFLCSAHFLTTDPTYALRLSLEFLSSKPKSHVLHGIYRILNYFLLFKVPQFFWGFRWRDKNMILMYCLLVYITTLSEFYRLHSVTWLGGCDLWFGKRKKEAVLGYFNVLAQLSASGTEENTETHDFRILVWVSNPGLPEYEGRVLSITPVVRCDGSNHIL